MFYWLQHTLNSSAVLEMQKGKLCFELQIGVGPKPGSMSLLFP